MDHISLEDSDRIIEHKFWVRLRSGRIVNDCSASAPYSNHNNVEFCILYIPHKDFGTVRIEFSAITILNAMNNGTPLLV